MSKCTAPAGPFDALKRRVEEEHLAYLKLRTQSLAAHDAMVAVNREEPTPEAGKDLRCSEHPEKAWRHDDCNAPKIALGAIWLSKKAVVTLQAQKLAAMEQEALDALSGKMIGLRVVYWYPANVGGPGSTPKIDPQVSTITSVLRSGKVNLVFIRNGSTQHEREFSDTPQASRWGWLSNGLV